MTDDTKKYYFAVIGIVAIVAIVAIVGLVYWLSGNKAYKVSDESDSYNLAGQAGEELKFNICTDSDGGRKIYFRGRTSGREKDTGRFVRETDYCVESGPKEGRLVEYFCADNGRVASESYGPEDDCRMCSNGACRDKCASHIISITNVSNETGKIAVSYKSLNVGVKVNAVNVQLFVRTKLFDKGTVEKIDCPISSGACGANRSLSCKVKTQCFYPTEKPNTRYAIRLTDRNCQAVYDEEEIKP